MKKDYFKINSSTVKCAVAFSTYELQHYSIPIFICHLIHAIASNSLSLVVHFFSFFYFFQIKYWITLVCTGKIVLSSGANAMWQCGKRILHLTFKLYLLVKICSIFHSLTLSLFFSSFSCHIPISHTLAFITFFSLIRIEIFIWIHFKRLECTSTARHWFQLLLRRQCKREKFPKKLNKNKRRKEFSIKLRLKW
jgi:hypothetical protein